MDISLFIFLSVAMIVFGYIAGNSRSFNIWKLLLLGMILVPFIDAANMGRPQLFTMLVAFLVGYFLPYAHMLDGLGDSLSDLINAVRYRDAYEDIRRKEEEVEELRRKYEQAEREANSGRQEQERQRRKQQSQDYRKSQNKDKKQSSGQHKTDEQKSQYEYHQKKSHTQQSSSGDSRKSKYLSILGLDPTGTYSYADIKKAYRRQAAKYHPDKHHSKGESVWKEMNERFKEVKEAYEMLGVYGA